MLKKRLVAVIIVRDEQVVQSVKFKHTNAIHYDAVHAIECFNKWAVDEIVVLNVSRERQSRDLFARTLERISRECFVPLSAGGWVDDAEYASQLLRSGADKLVINTAFADGASLTNELSGRYGRQCIVASMDVKQGETGQTTVWVDRGRRDTGFSAAEWARHVVANGAGEIFFNSIDHDGNRRGYNLAVLQDVCRAVDVPVIAFGGVFSWGHLREGLDAGAQAVAVANQFHYTEQSTRKAKKFLIDSGEVMRAE